MLRLTASDGQLTNLAEVSLTVLGNAPPAVNAGVDQTLTLPTRQAALNGTVTDDGPPVGSSVTATWSLVSGPAEVTFADPAAASTAATFDAAGTYLLRLTATDAALSASDDVTVTVQAGALAGPPPVVVITSPADGAAVTEPIDITGSVAGDSLLVWKLQCRRNGETGPFTTLAQGSTPASGVIARFDATLLLNGQYDVQFVATDTSSRTTATGFTAVVKENLKVGNFSVSFTDLEVPVAGLPIRVTRTYDSRDRGSIGDFGHGWRVDMSDVKLQENGVAGLLWYGTKSPGFLRTYCLKLLEAAGGAFLCFILDRAPRVVTSPRTRVGPALQSRANEARMSTTVDAIYENGVFKPEQPVELEDKTKVHLVIEKVALAPAVDDDDPTGWKTIDRLIGCIEDTPPGAAIGRDHDKYLYE